MPAVDQLTPPQGPAPPTSHVGAEPGRLSAHPAFLPAPHVQPWQRDETNAFAIAALVLGLVGAFLLSVTFGIIALHQISRRGQRGRGLAIAGISISVGWVLVLGGAVTWLVVTNGSPRTPVAVEAPREVPAPAQHEVTIVPARHEVTEDLWLGDCVDWLVRNGGVISQLREVSCGRHSGGVDSLFDLTGDWPGEAEVAARAADGCVGRAKSHPAVRGMPLIVLTPAESDWPDNRRVACIVVL